MDTVLGDNKSPTWEDLDAGRLPYTSALAREIVRWRTVTVLGGIPHAPVCDDTYRGYLIPKGTQLTCNTWAIHRNPGDFPEPDVVRPERYLGDLPGGLAFEYPNSRGHNAFGWGRRQCSGQPLADQSVSMVVARLVWAFKVQPGLNEKVSGCRPAMLIFPRSIWTHVRRHHDYTRSDAGREHCLWLTISSKLKGNPVQLSAFAYNDSENIRPLPFKARFTPRSSKIEKLIRSEAREAAQRLSIYDGDTKLTLESVLANQKKL